MSNTEKSEQENLSVIRNVAITPAMNRDIKMIADVKGVTDSQVIRDALTYFSLEWPRIYIEREKEYLQKYRETQTA